MKCKCGFHYNGDVHKNGKCGTCQRLGETRKRTKTDGERDVVDFMSTNMGFQLTHGELRGRKL